MLASELREKVGPLLAERKLQSVIHATFDLDGAPAAHALMESSKHIGKIMLAVKGG
jgi:NADPH2:quinone reductase